MELQKLQEELCNLIKGRDQPLHYEDKYLSTIRVSKNLALVKRIATWWRRRQIQAYCPLTCALLIRFEKLDLAISSFFSFVKFSPFREEVGFQFLNYLSELEIDSIVQTMAKFETAILKLNMGHSVDYHEIWDYDPHVIISGLLNGNLDLPFVRVQKFAVQVSHSFGENWLQCKTVEAIT